jgi:hypothetical protein
MSFFSKLNNTFGGGVVSPTAMNFTSNVRKYSELGPNDVIYTTDNEQDYNNLKAKDFLRYRFLDLHPLYRF